MLRLDNRENARMVEMCYKNHTTLINPIIDWTTAEVWEFIHKYNVPYCCLYDEGFKRLGCIGCPMGSAEQRRKEFERYPKYANLYKIAFQKMIENNLRKEEQRADAFKNADLVMDGYINERWAHETSKNKAPELLDKLKTTGGGTQNIRIGEPIAKNCTECGSIANKWTEMTPDEIMEWWID